MVKTVLNSKTVTLLMLQFRKPTHVLFVDEGEKITAAFTRANNFRPKACPVHTPTYAMADT